MIATEDIAKPKSSEWMTQPVGSGINAQAAVTHSARDRERERGKGLGIGLSRGMRRDGLDARAR